MFVLYHLHAQALTPQAVPCEPKPLELRQLQRQGGDGAQVSVGTSAEKELMDVIYMNSLCFSSIFFQFHWIFIGFSIDFRVIFLRFPVLSATFKAGGNSRRRPAPRHARGPRAWARRRAAAGPSKASRSWHLETASAHVFQATFRPFNGP